MTEPVGILVTSDNGAEVYADANCMFLGDVILVAQPTQATTGHRRRVNRPDRAARRRSKAVLHR